MTKYSKELSPLAKEYELVSQGIAFTVTPELAARIQKAQKDLAERIKRELSEGLFKDASES